MESGQLLLQGGFGCGDGLFHRIEFSDFFIRELFPETLRRLSARLRRRERPRTLALGFAPIAPLFPLEVVPESFCAAESIEAENNIRDSIEQEAVVRHEDERAREFKQALFQDFERGNVEIVR